MTFGAILMRFLCK